MRGYRGDEERTAEAMRDGFYRTRDVASQDADGYVTYVGRADDVFKAGDYRISPFERESVLIEVLGADRAEALRRPARGPGPLSRRVRAWDGIVHVGDLGSRFGDLGDEG
jgi:acyl-CoA synthetase (AMP-forming)/AMP-acid ligase II